MSDITDISYGQFLKQGREDKKFSLLQLSQKTKISIKILEALEHDRFNGLPPKSYLIGFTRSYAREVGLSPEKCIELLELALQKSELEKPAIMKDDRRFPQINLNVQDQIKDIDTLQDVSPQGWRFPLQTAMIALAFVVVIGLGIYGIRGQIKTAKKEISDLELATQATSQGSSEEVISPTPPLSAEISLEEVAPTIAPPIASEAPVTVTATPNPLKAMAFATMASAQATGTSMAGLTYDKIFFYRKLTPPLYSFAPIEGEKAEEIYPKSAREANRSLSHRLFIRATKGDSWITYKADGDSIRALTLKMGDTLEIPANEVILIFMGNAQRLTLIFNDQLVVYSAPKGFKSLVFPESQITNYSLPLFVTEDDGKIYTSTDYAKLNKKEIEKQTTNP